MPTVRSYREHKLNAIAPVKPLRPLSVRPPESFSDKAAEIAEYYGFARIDTPRLSRIDSKEFGFDKPEFIKDILATKGNLLGLRPESKIAVMRHYLNKNLENEQQPVMLYHAGSTFVGGKNRDRECVVLGLEVIGSPKSIAEALIVKTASVILTEAGFQNVALHINSLGDKDSYARFTRELGNFYKKHTATLSKHCKENLKRDPLLVLSCSNEGCEVLRHEAPKALSYLTEPSRRHLREVLEYLESMQIPYEVDHSLIGSRNFYSKTLIEIRTVDDGLSETPVHCFPIAHGGRYDMLARRMGAKRDIPAVGISIAFDRSLEPKHIKLAAVRKPKLYFVQLGFDAKLKSLEVMEMLRQAKIPVMQALSKDKLAQQLSTAENMQIPYTIIMGQKEALDGAVIVRDMSNRSQETVSISNLSLYLKALR